MKGRSNRDRVRFQRTRERLNVRVPHRFGNAVPLFLASWKSMGLPLVLNLKSMFNPTQKNVRVAQSRNLIARQQIQLLDCSKRLECVPLLQKRIPRSVQKLQRLHDKFDLSDSSVSKFHISMQILSADQVAFDSCLELCNLVQQVAGKGARKDKWLQSLIELVEQFLVATDTASFDQSHSFPRLAVTGVVVLQACKRTSERTGSAFRP